MSTVFSSWTGVRRTLVDGTIPVWAKLLLSCLLWYPLALMCFFLNAALSWETFVTLYPFISVLFHPPNTLSTPAVIHKYPACPCSILMPPVCLECWSTTLPKRREGHMASACSLWGLSPSLYQVSSSPLNCLGESEAEFSGSSPTSEGTVVLYEWCLETPILQWWYKQWLPFSFLGEKYSDFKLSAKEFVFYSSFLLLQVGKGWREVK